MAVKDILKYKQRGDRTVHWVREGSKPKYHSFNITTTPMSWGGQFGSAASSTGTQLASQAQQQYQPYYQPVQYSNSFATIGNGTGFGSI